MRKIISAAVVCTQIIFNSCNKETLSNSQQQPLPVPVYIQVNSKVIFWTRDPYDQNYGYGIVPVEVTINNETKTLWSYFEYPGPTAPLQCISVGTLRFDLPAGIYFWKASQPGFNKIATGSFTIMSNQCLTQELTF